MLRKFDMNWILHNYKSNLKCLYATSGNILSILTVCSEKISFIECVDDARLKMALNAELGFDDFKVVMKHMYDDGMLNKEDYEILQQQRSPLKMKDKLMFVTDSILSHLTKKRSQKVYDIINIHDAMDSLDPQQRQELVAQMYRCLSETGVIIVKREKQCYSLKEVMEPFFRTASIQDRSCLEVRVGWPKISASL